MIKVEQQQLCFDNAWSFRLSGTGFYYSASESIKMTDKLIAASQETIKTNVVAKIERL
jgi:hypothetical protein